MTRLPLEILLMIFKKIDFINLIKLRSICKDWKYIIDNFKIVKQLIIQDKYDQISSRNKSITYLDQFKLDSYEIFRKIIGSNILHNLKYLNYSFKCSFNQKNKLIHLNCFKFLENLVLKIDLEEESKQIVLVHPNIKYLSVSVNYNLITNNDFILEINCPKCENLTITGQAGLNDYDIIYPDRIKIFKSMICNLDDNGYEIDKFINVEQLDIEICCLDSNNGISLKISKFNQLKKLIIRYDDFKNCSNGNWYCINNIRDLLYDLIDLFSSKEILIFLNDTKIESKKQVKKLIDTKIGRSLDFIIFGEVNGSNISDFIEFSYDPTDNEE